MSQKTMRTVKSLMRENEVMWQKATEIAQRVACECGGGAAAAATGINIVARDDGLLVDIPGGTYLMTARVLSVTRGGGPEAATVADVCGALDYAVSRLRRYWSEKNERDTANIARLERWVEEYEKAILS